MPCVVHDTATEILAEEDSLAENIQRAPLHPLDQFRAFLSLRVKELSDEEIAAAVFARSLGEAAPAVCQCPVDFTVSSEHARQEQVWETISASWSKKP
jgi:ParB family chromosome partitioning protein